MFDDDSRMCTREWIFCLTATDDVVRQTPRHRTRERPARSDPKHGSCACAAYAMGVDGFRSNEGSSARFGKALTCPRIIG